MILSNPSKLPPYYWTLFKLEVSENYWQHNKRRKYNFCYQLKSIPGVKGEQWFWTSKTSLKISPFTRRYNLLSIPYWGDLTPLLCCAVIIIHRHYTAQQIHHHRHQSIFHQGWVELFIYVNSLILSLHFVFHLFSLSIYVCSS